MYLTFWGKAQPVEGSATSWHPAAFHGLDVAAVAQAWLEAHPDAATASARAGGWDIVAWNRGVPFLVALHDAGKFSRSFQAKARDHWPAVLGGADAGSDPGHDTTGFALLADPDTAPAALDRVFGGWDPWHRDPLLRAVTGHHGRPPAEDATIHGLSSRVACRACRAALEDYATAVAAVLDPPALPPPTEAGAAVSGWWLAHLTALADWVGSAQAWFPYVAPGVECDLESYWHGHALPRARRAVDEAGLLPAAAAPAGGLSALMPGVAPTPSQRLAAELPLSEGPSLVLVEDATGSGKTEAALVLAHRLIADGGAEGVFLALPTMATADAMFGRVAAAYRRLYAPDAAPSLALAHGRAELNSLFRGAILAGVGREETATGDAADQPASAQCAAWLAEGRRRAFLAHVGVGTLDQALLAVLPARHAPLRLGGLARKVLVVDEAHAYDAYMGEELARLLRFQAALGGSAVVLSATLPQTKRAALVAAFREGLGAPRAPLESTAYPLVTAAGAASVAEQPCAMRDGLTRRLPVRRLETAEGAAREIAAAAEQGACVAWIRNTVADALAGAELLRAAGRDPLLFHARFAMGDRLDRQDAVMACSPGRGVADADPAARRGRIVVATQVVEQSLDLDFDLLVSDLAPVDLLIQRAGRLWRHPWRAGRPVPAPELLVVSPPAVADPAADWAAGALGATRFVYRPDLLWRTARALFAANGGAPGERGEIATPDGVRGLVEAVYGEVAPPVPPGLAYAERKGAGEDAAARGLAWTNLLDVEKGYRRDQGGWDTDTRTPTRLGEEQVTFRLAREERGLLVPWYAHAEGRIAWALSEISVRHTRANDAVVPPRLADALRRLKAGWRVWEREVPVLLLECDEENGWRGRVLRRDEEVGVTYDRASGLRLSS